MKSLIQKEIDKRKEIYQQSPADMVSAFNREVETEKAYNGRQLLELLQNADDAQSEEVRIDLDTVNNILTISNRGKDCTAFSAKGIRSLMLSDLSPKTSNKYIGNKGLGFRSIINWSEKISINSNNLNIEFSREIVNQVFDELFTTPKQHAEIRELSGSVYPIPFLFIPKVSDKINQDWITSISIKYKPQFLEDIQKQINDLKDEILLFLNSIQCLEVCIEAEPDRLINKDYLSEKWKVHKIEDELPKELCKENEEKNYDLRIALQKDLTCDVKELFAYFPTKIAINFPFIVHGTFELDPSRNGIIDSPKNRFILLKLVELIVSTAKELTKDEVSFKALEMLPYTNPNNILFDLGFYDGIKKAIETESIFPCLDGKYRSKTEVVFANELSIFVQEVNKEVLFENLIIPFNETVDISTFSDIKKSISTKSLIKLSKSITCLKERASLIYMFYKTYKHNEIKLEFLVDSEGDIIPLDNDVYTPSTQKLSIPDYVNIKFIHKELFDQLVIKFKIESNEKARDLQRTLKEITNIQTYEPAPVIQKIISSTNSFLTEKPTDKVGIISKMVLSLYENYLQFDKTKIPSDRKVQLLNKNGVLSDAKDLYLSNSYPSGKLTEFLFEGIFDNEDYLADFSYFGFKDQDLKNVEQFFLWLGVNKYTKFIPRTDVQENDYTEFVFEHCGKPIGHKENLLSYTEIAHFNDIVEYISLEKLVIWFYSDKYIYQQLDSTSHGDIFKYKKYREWYYNNTLIEIPSFMIYQVKSRKLFEDFLIKNDSLSQLINDIKFDFEYEAFEKYGLNRPDIESILIKLGAVNKFEDLSIAAVSSIVDSLNSKSPDGKQTQSIYKLCIKHFEKNSQPLNASDTFLFATKDNVKTYFPSQEVFYNGNIKLPKKITSAKAIFNYPRRQSTTNVINFFDINDLSSINIEINDKAILESLNKDFTEFLDTITPYILVYRIKDIEKNDLAENEIAKLKNISISICDYVRYTIDGNSSELDNNDYIRDEKDYFIKVDQHSSLDKLRHEFEFQECFADIIGLVFDIQETKVFRDMVREEDSYIEKTIINDIGGDVLARAKNLLGILDEHCSFWKTIYTLKSKNYAFDTNDHLLANVIADLKIKSDISAIDYLHLNRFDSCNSIIRLFEELEIDILQFNKCEHSYYKIDLFKFHKRHLKQAFENSLYDVKRKLYSWCIDQSEEKMFTTHIYTYDSNDDFIKSFSKENNLNSIIDYNKIVQSFINEHFDLSDTKATETDFVSVYTGNEKIINIDDLEGNREYLSLLYFDNKTEEIKEYIDRLKQENNTETDREKIQDHNKPVKEAKEVALGRPNPVSNTKNRKPYKHSASSETRNKAIGNTSEEDVYTNLINKYSKSNVTWISKDDDGYGCDFKYINKEGVTKYVEVKTFSGNKFHISKNEIEFAKNHIGLYEIFLVAEEIYIIKDINFEDENQFRIEEQEFIVYYNIENSDNPV